MGWFARRRLQQNCTRFGALLREGEVSTALEFFDEKLAAEGTEVARPLRVAYHLLSWLADREDENLRSVRALAGSAAGDGAVARAWRLAQRLHREHEVARAVGKRSPELLTAPPTRGDPRNETYEKVGRALLELYSLPAAPTQPQREAAARAVLECLPHGAALDGPARPAFGHLFAWAGLVLGQHKPVVEGRAALAGLPDARREQALGAAVFGWGRAALLEDRADEARAALDIAAEVSVPAAAVRSSWRGGGPRSTADCPPRRGGSSTRPRARRPTIRRGGTAR